MLRKELGKKNVQHFIGRADFSKNKHGMYWMQFLKQTVEPGKFTFNDDGLVTPDEIVEELENPMDDLVSSSRAGKVTFPQEIIVKYQGTLK